MSTFRPARDEIEPGIPATTEQPPDVPEGWEAEEEPPPRDYPQGVTEWGTTAREEALGESLRQRVSREVPDDQGGAEAGGVRVLDNEDTENSLDVEADLVGDLAEDTDSSLSPEEAAMRVVDEPPGASYEPTPGYLDEGE